MKPTQEEINKVCKRLNSIAKERGWYTQSNSNTLFMMNGTKLHCIRIEERYLGYLQKNRNTDKQQVLKWIKEIILEKFNEITQYKLTLYISNKYILDFEKEDFINEPHIDLF